MLLQNLNIPTQPNAIHIGPTSRPGTAGNLTVHSPIDGSLLATLPQATPADVDAAATAAHEAFLKWRTVPAPRRGEFVRQIAEKVRQKKQYLGELISLEVGKITQEGLGEVQEWIDMCDFAVGLSRQLHGLTIASERPGHRMMEQWHPLGPVGCITAFNFPMAVWAWNAMLAFICGDPVIWKPSEKTPLSALACHQIVTEVQKDFPEAQGLALSSVLIGGPDVGAAITDHPLLPLISATGSTRMGQAVAQGAAKRLASCLLELGGNNAMIVTPSADLELAVRAITFAAVGTAGQRCTTLRRLIVHKSVQPKLVERLKKIYTNLKIGDPLVQGNLVGPLIDKHAFDAMQHALTQAREQGGTIHGGERIHPPFSRGSENRESSQHSALSTQHSYYARPALVELPRATAITKEETFAPILYIIPYDTLEEALDIHNNVPQGLSSAIFTSNVQESELFLSPAGSDCGIANVNIGTSGAEIGGAFGGEKSTGGGRESGSDAWKNYMRRTTNTLNYSKALPLAQGIHFDV